jgi:hypothetical protein
MHTQMSTPNRRNVYFRSPLIYEAFQEAIDKGVISGRSASDRIEQLVVRDVRKVVALMKKAGISIPKELLLK